MDTDSIIWTLLFGLIYGYLLYFFTWYRVYDNLIRIYYGFSLRRFHALYDMTQDGYISYSYFNDPSLTNSQYLQAFEKYDVDIAYTEFRQTILNGINRFILSSLKNGVILLIVGFLLFPIPLFGYTVVVGYFVLRLLFRFIGPYGLSTGLTMTSHDLVRSACLYAYGHNESMKLLERQSPTKIDTAPEVLTETFLARILSINQGLWSGKRWTRTMLIWICCFVPLGFLAGFTDSGFVSEIVGIIGLLYIFFPLGFLIYKFQEVIESETIAEESATVTQLDD